jgi:tetratricopeptide (TPR) repeat protein
MVAMVSAKVSAAVLVLGVLGLVRQARADETDRLLDPWGGEQVEEEAWSASGTAFKPGPLHAWTRHDELRARLEAAHREAPQDDAATVRLAVFEDRTGNPRRAIELLDGVAPVSSLYALARYDRGLAELRAGDAALAKEAFARAIEASPDRAEPVFALGIAEERLGDAKAAVEAFASAEKKAQGALAAACALRLGHVHEEAGELDAALAAYQRAGGLETGPAPGVVLALGADGSGARATGESGRTTGPLRAAVDAGRVLLRLGRPAEAALAYEKALASGEDADARFHHGLALYLSGRAADDDVARLRAGNAELADRLAAIVARKREGR